MLSDAGPKTATTSNAKGKALIWWLTAIGCALFAFDDISVLRRLGGGLLASPGWIPILIAGWLATRSPDFKKLRLTGVLTSLFSYGVFITLLTLPFLAGDLLGESPLVKSAKFAFSVGVWLLLLTSGAVLSRMVPKAIQIGAAVAIVLMLAGALLYRFGIPLLDESSLFHSYHNIQQRVRSTRFEASSLGSGLIVCLGLVAMYSRRKLALIGFSICLVLIGLVAESRGTTLTILVTLLVVPMAMWVRFTKTCFANSAVRFWAIIVAAMAILLSFRLDYFLGSPLWSALGLKTEGTSDASRSMWADASVSALAQYPFGMGYAAYLDWLPKLVESAARSAMGQFPIRDLSEMIYLSLATTDATLSPKNLVGIAAVHWGIVGLIAVGVLYSATISSSVFAIQLRENNRLIVATALIIVSSTYYSSIFSMDQAFLFGALAWGGGRLARFDDNKSVERFHRSLMIDKCSQGRDMKSGNNYGQRN